MKRLMILSFFAVMLIAISLTSVSGSDSCEDTCREKCLTECNGKKDCIAECKRPLDDNWKINKCYQGCNEAGIYRGIEEENQEYQTSMDRLDNLKKILKQKGNRQKAQQYHKKAMAKHRKKKYSESEELWYEAALADPSWARAYFNLACSITKKSEQAGQYGNTIVIDFKIIAIEYLKIVLKLNPSKFKKSMEVDSDLNSLRGMTEFKALMSQ